MKKKFLAKPADSFDFKEILYAKKDWVANVTINRPEAYNAYTTQTVRELFVAFKETPWNARASTARALSAAQSARGCARAMAAGGCGIGQVASWLGQCRMPWERESKVDSRASYPRL